VAFSGCASAPKCSTKPTFFPPPPDEPRIQWLTGITNSKDVGVKESQSSFSLVVTGKETGAIVRKIGKSYGVAVHKGKIYVSESNESRVTIIDPVHQTYEYLKGMAHPKGALIAPVNVCFDADDNLYVADPGRREIVVFDAQGEYLTSYGRDLAEKTKIVSLAVYNGELYALDAANSRIRVLDRKTGQQQRELGYIEQPNQSLRFPANMAIDKKGGIYVTNTGSNRVIKYDIDGNFLGSFGQNTDQLGNFVKPKGIQVDDNGLIYVVDGGANVVQLFDDKFRLLTYFGWPGLETGSLNAPTGIAVTTDLVDYYQKYAVKGFKLERLVFVVNQFGSDFCIPPVTIYGLGEMKK
jgi:DNA-binding beta-propeller fold protein YncE